jgi:hypothetical protein
LNATGGDDPWSLLAARVGRIADGAEDRLLEQQLTIVRDELIHATRTPLGLARALAQSKADAAPTDKERQERAVAELTGLAALTDPTRAPDIRNLFARGAAVHLVDVPAAQ